MTVRELAEKLNNYKYQDAEIDIGCNSDYGHCLYAHVGPDDDNVFICDYPENCGYYVKNNECIDDLDTNTHERNEDDK